jgi:hypothetical protein
MSFVSEFLRWVRTSIGFFFGWLGRFERKEPPLRGVWVDDFPDKLDRTRFYIAGDRPNAWGAAMMCPCGCGDVIELNLLKKARPSWSVEEYPDTTVSVKPSVWRQKGCRSHFVVARGRIAWCEPMASNS